MMKTYKELTVQIEISLEEMNSIILGLNGRNDLVRSRMVDWVSGSLRDLNKDMPQILWIPVTINLTEDLGIRNVIYRVIVFRKSDYSVFRDMIALLNNDKDYTVLQEQEVIKDSWTIVMYVKGINNKMSLHERNKHIITSFGSVIPVNRIISCEEQNIFDTDCKRVCICLMENDFRRFISEFNEVNRLTNTGEGDIISLFVEGGLELKK